MTDLIVIVGPTASGKTVLGVEAAERLGGEVVSADAFAVYRGMDIGTAKPSPVQRARVRHYLIDVADPRERYSAGMFVRDADQAIREILSRGGRPVVVGGTHFYVRALLYGLFPEPPKDPRLRERLEREWRADPAALRRRLTGMDPESAARIAVGDRQRTLRALEVCELSGRPMTELWREHPRGEPRHRFAMFGLSPRKDLLRARIAVRVEGMFAAGLVREVEELLAAGVSPQAHAFKAIGYRESCRVLDGTLSLPHAIEEAVAATRRLAKRQMTWLRGERDVQWLPGEADDAVGVIVSRVEARGGTGTGPG